MLYSADQDTYARCIGLVSRMSYCVPSAAY